MKTFEQIEQMEHAAQTARMEARDELLKSVEAIVLQLAKLGFGYRLEMNGKRGRPRKGAQIGQGA